MNKESDMVESDDTLKRLIEAITKNFGAMKATEAKMAEGDIFVLIVLYEPGTSTEDVLRGLPPYLVEAGIDGFRLVEGGLNFKGDVMIFQDGKAVGTVFASREHALKLGLSQE